MFARDIDKFYFVAAHIAGKDFTVEKSRGEDFEMEFFRSR
jgi:hypothetical protein